MSADGCSGFTWRLFCVCSGCGGEWKRVHWRGQDGVVGSERGAEAFLGERIGGARCHYGLNGHEGEGD